MCMHACVLENKGGREGRREGGDMCWRIREGGREGGDMCWRITFCILSLRVRYSLLAAEWDEASERTAVRTRSREEGV